jgi:hypothetical protein
MREDAAFELNPDDAVGVRGGELREVGLHDREDATRLVVRVVGGEQDRSSRAGEADAARDPHERLGLPAQKAT